VTARQPESAATGPQRDADPLPSWSTLVTVYQAVLHDVVAELDRRVGMDSGVFSALAYLERADPPHRMPMGELQRAMHPRYSQSGFSRLVQRMEQDGVVERRTDANDRRASVIVTTRAGRAQFRVANAVYVDALQQSFGRHLGPGDHERVATILRRVVARRRAEADGELAASRKKRSLDGHFRRG
jgi:DNA-binding MarR family transcriptional regulator